MSEFMFFALLLFASSLDLPDLPRVGDHVTIIGAAGSGSATAGEDYLYLRFYWMSLENEAFDDMERLESEGWLTDLPEGATAEVLDIDFVKDPRSVQPDLVQIKMLDAAKHGETFWVSLVSVKVAR